MTTIPDAQTRLAKIMVGDLDLVFHVDYDQAKAVVAQNPDYKIVVAPTISFDYIFFDSADRSGIHVFKDKRVREALLAAIDVQAMRKALLPPEFAAQPRMQAMCRPEHVGCSSSVPPVAYDPAHAKQLLADAGLSGGFDLDAALLGPGHARSPRRSPAICARSASAPASSAPPSMSSRPRAARARPQTQVTLWDNGGGAPDIDTTAQFFYAPSSRNYTGDKQLAQWTDDARA